MSPYSARSAAPHARVPLATLAAHAIGAFAGLCAALAYDTAFWLDLRGREMALSMPQFIAAVAHAIALALPAAFVAAFAGALVERISFRGRVPSLFRMTAWLSPAPDELAHAAVTLGTLVGAVAAFHACIVLVQSKLHAPQVIAIVLAVAAPFVMLVFSGMHRVLLPPARRFAVGLDGAACPLVFHGVLVAVAVAARMHFAEVETALDRTLPWYTVWTLGLGAITHLLVAFGLPRGGIGGRRVRGLGLGLLLLGSSATAVSILTYDRTTSQRFYVEELSWIGTRAHRAWAELLDHDGDGHPSLLAGGDCNDRASSVHPGAFDAPGDGVDSDCFGGDGAPRFDDRRPMAVSAHPVDARPLNIVMISVDTMRPDRLRADGSRRTVTPRLDRFLRESVWFEQVTAQSPRTVRSLPSVFTGQYPGALDYETSLGRVDLTQGSTTLAELLSARMETSAVLGTSYFQAIPGLLQGFVNVEHAPAMKPAPEWATAHALTAISRMKTASRPSLLWVHYFGAHEPYLGDRFPSRFGPTPMDGYDTELYRADHEIGRILDHLTAEGLASNTAVVVFSDHGESFGEHGAYGHSTRVNEDQARAVLMVRAPGLAPRIVHTPVALFDLFPTVLDLANTVAPDPISARNLLPAMRGDSHALVNRPVFCEVMPDAVYAIEAQSVRLGNDKLIYWPRTQRAAYFDLRTDPFELRDLADARPRTTRRLLGILLDWYVASHRDENRIAAVLHDAVVRRLPNGVPRIDATYANGITLVAATLAPSNPARDSVFVVDLYFRADRPIPSDYYIHLTFDPADGVSNGAHFEAHHTALDGAYPTSLWRPGETFRDRVTIRVPDTVQPNVPLVARVEIWGNFHLRQPVTVVRNGVSAEAADVGTMTVR